MEKRRQSSQLSCEIRTTTMKSLLVLAAFIALTSAVPAKIRLGKLAKTVDDCDGTVCPGGWVKSLLMCIY